MPKIEWAEIKRDLCLDGISQIYFWKSNWEKFNPEDEAAANSTVSSGYLVYRLVYFVLFLTGMLQGLCSNLLLPGPYYFIFLTGQTYTLQVIYSGVYFLYILWTYIRTRLERPSGEVVVFSGKLPIICKIIWVMQSLLQVAPFFVTIGFFAVIIPMATHQLNLNEMEVPKIGFCLHCHNVIVHVMNSVGALLEALVVSVPYRPAHCVFPFLYALYYGMFTLLYEVWNGQYPLYAVTGNKREYIYWVLNWRRKPGIAAISYIAAMILSVLGFFLFGSCTFKLRRCLRKKYVDVTPELTPSLEDDATTTSTVNPPAEFKGNGGITLTLEIDQSIPIDQVTVVLVEKG